MAIEQIVHGESVQNVTDKLNPVIGAVNGMMAGAFNPLDNHSSRDEDNSIATVTIGALDGSLTKEINIIDNPEKFHVNGYMEQLVNSYGSRLLQVSSEGGGNAGSDGAQVCACYSFIVPSDRFAIRVTTGYNYNIKIDGVFIQKVGYTVTGSGYTYIDVLFTSDKPSGRLVQIYTGASGATVRSVWITPISDITNPKLSEKRVAFVGDSYSTNTEVNDHVGLSWPSIMADAFAWHKFMPNGLGATGFIADHSGTNYNFSERIPDLVTFGAEKLILCASVNDNSYTAAAIIAAVTAYFDGLFASLPNVEVVVLGPPGIYAAESEANELAVKSAVDAYNTANNKNIIFVPSQTQQDGGLVFGTGKLGSETGDGNADIYINTSSHYTFAGYVYWANRMIPEMIRQGVTY